MKKNEIKIAVSMTNSHLFNTGLGEFENSIAQRLSKRAQELKEKYGIQLYFLVKPCQIGAYGDDVKYVSIGSNMRTLMNLPFLHNIKRLLLPHFDLLHWTNQFLKFRVKLAPLQLMTVHDVNFLHNEIGTLHKSKKLWLTNRRLKRATHFGYISNFTKNDIEANFKLDGKPGRVIYNGVTNLNTKSQYEYNKILSGMNLPENFLFHISRWSRKKNVHLLVQMMKYLPGETLVIAGSADKKYVEFLNNLVLSKGIKNVIFVGKVSTDQKAALLSRCKAMMFPSLSEGFGLPVVEAMCFGKPSFITRLTSLPEVGGKIEYYFDSLNPVEMANKVERGLADFYSDPIGKGEKLKKRATKFNWDNTVEEYINYYLDILGIERK